METNRKQLTLSAAAVLAFGIAVACQPQGATQKSTPTPAEKPAKPEYKQAATSARPDQAKPNEFWWPETLNLKPLRNNGQAPEFDYAKAFQSVDLAAVKKDIDAVLTSSQEWWPADYGNYGPLFIRMAWHAAGTYRVSDGRGGADGGQQRFEPLNSWPDNTNLDKARRLLEPVKRKYGRNISWADLMILAGNVAMENMGFKTLGFAGGRVDDSEPDLVYWGPETEMLASKRWHGNRQLKHGLAASRMGLIYVNPEGPDGNADPMAAAKDIRQTFGQMAMNDEETVALIAGGHTFGKAHGAHKADECLQKEPAGAMMAEQGLGWYNKCGKGNAEDTVTSGLEGAWTSAPVQWTHQYLTNLFAFEWKKTKSPAGATQWRPTDDAADKLVPDAHDADKRHAPMMFTTDLSLRTDPAYLKISQRFKDNPKEFEEAFAKAWFKLTHRDMGPKIRYLGPEVPKDEFIWQDPVPKVDYKLIGDNEVAMLKAKILASGASVTDLVKAAWASASSYRNSDMRGGANGARIRLAPQKDWPANDPAQLGKVLAALEKVQKEFNQSLSGGKRVSFADVVVLAGAAAIEKAAKDAGVTVKVPFSPGRTDAAQAMTDTTSFGYLEPKADAFRNYYTDKADRSPADMMVDKADLLDLNIREMTALVGGMRALGANANQSKHGMFTTRPGVLSNDFFANLLDMTTAWKPSGTKGVFEGRDRKSGDVRWTATEVDLVFGSNAELRSIAEEYAYDGGNEMLVEDFVAAWTKVMQADRFDLI